MKALAQKLAHQVRKDLKKRGEKITHLSSGYPISKRTIYQLNKGIVTRATVRKLTAHLGIEIDYRIKKVEKWP